MRSGLLHSPWPLHKFGQAARVVGGRERTRRRRRERGFIVFFCSFLLFFLCQPTDNRLLLDSFDWIKLRSEEKPVEKLGIILLSVKRVDYGSKKKLAKQVAF